MNRFLRGQQWLNKRMGENASITIIYHYGTGESDFVTITDSAWQGRTAFRIQDNANTRVHWNEADFLIPVDKLKKADDTLFQPKKGHWLEVVYTDPDETQNFEISAPDGEQEWRFSDSERTRYRIHCKAKKRSI